MKSFWVFFLSLFFKVQGEVIIIGRDLDEAKLIERVLKDRNRIESIFLGDYLEVLAYPVENVQLIIDASLNNTIHLLVYEFIYSHSIPCLVLGEGYSQNLIYYTHPDNTCKLSIISQVISYFSIGNFAAIWEYSESNLNIIKSFSTLYKKKVYEVNLKLNETQENTQKLLAKTIKVQGLTSYFIFNQIIKCSHFEEAIRDLYLENPWNIALYFGSCFFELTHNGSFGVVFESVEGASSWSEYIEMSLKSYLSYSNLKGMSKYEIKKILDRSLPKCRFSLVNVQSGQGVLVGTITPDSLEIRSSLVFFNNSQTRQVLQKPHIFLSANTGSKNPPGFHPSFQNSRYQKGTYFAISHINSQDTLLPNYNLTLFDKIECGVNVFDYNYSKDCFLKIRSKLGIAYVPSFYSMTFKVLNLFKDLQISTPFVSGMGTSTILSNSTLYPNFKRMVSPLRYLTVTYSRLLRIMGWDKVVVFYTNENFGNEIYDILLHEQKVSNYTIVNDEEFRQIDYFYTAANYSKYKAHIQNAVDTNCNIFLLAMSDPTPFVWVEALYDFGLRKGDISILLFTLSSPSAFLSSGSYEKRSELLYGSFTIYNAAWVDSYGESMAAKFFKTNTQDPMPSFYIDSILTIAQTADYLLNKGSCFEDPKVFIDGLKVIRFTGTSGTITFDSGSNDRSFFLFYVYNYYNDENGWRTEPIAKIDPLSSVYFKILKEATWSGGSYPTSIKSKYKDCAFLEEKVRESVGSSTVHITVCVFVFIIVAVVALYDIGKLPRGQLQIITEKQVPQFEDLLIFWFIFVESVQLISIGPNIEEFNSVASNLFNLISVKFTSNSYFRNSKYWVFYYALNACGYVWVWFFILSSFSIISRYIKCMRSVADYLSPLMANYLFIPFISGIISILSCEQSIGDQLTDSFFYYDCSLFCWNRSHINQALLGMVFLMLYIPISIYYRTRWQQVNKNLTIRADSFYLFIKNILVMTLIIFEKVVKNRSQVTHSLLFCFIVFLINLTVLKKNAFNYDRANLWIRIMSGCVLWNSVVCVVFNFVSIGNLGFFGLQMTGWLFLVILGLWLGSRMPEDLLYPDPQLSITDLFKFAFHSVPLQPSAIPSEPYSIEVES